MTLVTVREFFIYRVYFLFSIFLLPRAYSCALNRIIAHPFFMTLVTVREFFIIYRVYFLFFYESL